MEQGNWPAGTCHVIFEDVKVPLKNLIGAENHGFKALMLNFNHERFVISVQANRCARMCLQESVKYAVRLGLRLVSSGKLLTIRCSEAARRLERDSPSIRCRDTGYMYCSRLSMRLGDQAQGSRDGAVH